MTSVKMVSLFCFLISILVIPESFGQEICTSVNELKSKIYLDLAAEMISKARENIPTGSNDTSIISKKPRDCQELQQLGNSKNGVYTIWIRSKSIGEKRLNVYCDMVTDGGGWTVIQRRGNYSTPTDYFYRGWYSYKEGFGNIQEEFWFGNDNIFDITNQKLYSIRFDLKASSGEKAYAHYSSFWIDGEIRNYTIHITNYTGNAGDAMKSHDGQQFSTKDRDNDSDKARHCAQTFRGGWWYYSCYQANLNGLRGFDKDIRIARWTPFKNEQRSLEDIEIKIKPKSSEC